MAEIELTGGGVVTCQWCDRGPRRPGSPFCSDRCYRAARADEADGGCISCMESPPVCRRCAS